MKTSILFTCLSILTFVTFASDLKAEKKALIETIKSNYDSWQINQTPGDDADHLMDYDPSVNRSEFPAYLSKAPKEEITHIFSDFTFRMNNNQAVVQFQVDYQTISAFMEKKNGNWKLVCAAIIPPEL